MEIVKSQRIFLVALNFSLKLSFSTLFEYGISSLCMYDEGAYYIFTSFMVINVGTTMHILSWYMYLVLTCDFPVLFNFNSYSVLIQFLLHDKACCPIQKIYMALLEFC